MDGDMSLKGARDAQWRYVLQCMEDRGTCGFDWLALHLNCFVNDWITREMARAICRDLTDNGLAFYARGLFTDDGLTAGSGYGITEKGRAWLKENCERETA